MPRTCVLCSASPSRSEERHFFGFPSDPVLRQVWLKFCRISVLRVKEPFLCSDHFRPEDIVRFGSSRASLDKGATPVLREKQKENLKPLDARESRASPCITHNPESSADGKCKKERKCRQSNSSQNVKASPPPLLPFRPQRSAMRNIQVSSGTRSPLTPLNRPAAAGRSGSAIEPPPLIPFVRKLQFSSPPACETPSMPEFHESLSPQPLTIHPKAVLSALAHTPDIRAPLEQLAEPASGENSQEEVLPKETQDSAHEDVQEEVKRLRNRVRVLEEEKAALSQALAQSRETTSKKDRHLRSSRQQVRRLRRIIDKIDRKQIEKNNENLDEYFRLKKSATDEVLHALLRRMTGEDVGEYSDPHLRTFAISQHFYSPAGYRALRHVFPNALPSESTLRGWFSTIDGQPGFTQESFNALQALAKEQKRKLPVSLMVDDMAMRKRIQTLGENEVRGDINLGPGSEEIENLKEKPKKKENSGPDQPRLATDVCVFMVVCLDLKVKIPVGYFLHDKLNGRQLEQLVRRCMTDLYSVGVIVKALIADGAPANRTMATLLGANLNPIILKRHRAMGTIVQPREMKTFFPHPSDSQIRVFFLMDVCHMLKLVRNTLAGRKLMRDSEGNDVSWHEITALHSQQVKEGLRLGNKLTERHIHWYRNKQKVSVAAQTISRSVALSLLFCEMSMPSFKGAASTANFLLVFNDLFDVLNSFTALSYGCKGAMRLENESSWSEVLERAKQYIYGLTIRDPKRKTFHSVLESKRSVGFQGFLVAIESVKGLFDDLVRSGQLKYLCTYRLSQDHLESFFGKTRQRFGPDNNPTAVHFMGSYKRLLLGSEIASSRSANTMPLESIQILNSKETGAATRLARLKKEKERERRKIVSECVCLGLLTAPNVYFPSLSPFVRAIVGYIAGYVARELWRKMKCSTCNPELKKTEFHPEDLGDYGGLIALRDVNNGLTVPKKDVVFVCSVVEETIRMGNPAVNALKLKRLVTEREETIKRLVVHCLSKGAFSTLEGKPHLQGNATVHRQRLIADICRTYFRIRLKRMYSLFNDLNISKSLRHRYTKLVQFNNE